MKRYLAAVAATLGLLTAPVAFAFIAGPYTADSYTLHLWHLDESVIPCIDSVSTNAINLSGLANSATLGNSGYSAGSNSFGTSLNTATGGVAKGDLLAQTTATGNTTITLADATTGAFTFEALVQVQFDPTTNSTSPYEILSGESGTPANRIFQWRIAPKGFVLISGITASGPYMTFENIRAGSGSQNTIYAPIPTTGADAIVQNGWYHVAVTYSGTASTAGNFVMYWTAMNPTNTTADPLAITSVVTSLSGLNPLSTVSTPFCIGNQIRNKNGNFLGSIDEVRISRVARGAAGMMFAVPTISLAPLTTQFVQLGSTVTLSSLAAGVPPIAYQWQFNGSNISGVTNISGINSNTLVISNITYAEAGAYTLIANNSTSTNSVSSTVHVGLPISGLIGTGVDNGGNLLAGGSIDPHWQLVLSADPSYPGPNAIVDSVIPSTYAPNGPNSQWISPGDGANNAGGVYEYQTSFVLDSASLTNTQLTVNWGADNVCQDIILNGVDLNAGTGNGFTALAPSLITSNFVAGSNNLICVISNGPGTLNNFTAFRAEMTGLSGPLPPTAISILAGPVSTNVNQGQNAVFNVVAYGSGPVSYQWFFGASPIAGQTTRTLNLPNITPAQAGLYSVTIVNAISTNSAGATLAVTVPDYLEWVGTTSTDWDLGTPNFYDTNTASATAFSQGLNVLFDNAGASQPNVSVDVAVAPNSITMTSSSTYVLGGAGSLAGNFNTLVAGSGTLVFDGANTASGNIVISSGTLQVGNNDTAGTLGAMKVTNNATLAFNRTDAVTVPSAIAGSGALNHIGTGNLIVTGSNANLSGPVSVTGGGILTPRNSYALGAGSNTISVADGSEIYIDQNYNFANQTFVLGGTGNGGAGAIRKGGAGATYLGGPITILDYVGIGVDASSSLYLTNSAAITGTNQNLAVQVANAGVLQATGAINLGTGGLTTFGVSGNGAIVLANNNNNWTGGTTIAAFTTIQVGDGTNGSIGNGPINDGGALTYTLSGNFALTNQVSGSGLLTQAGNGQMKIIAGELSAFNGTLRTSSNGYIVLDNGVSLTQGSLTIGTGQADSNALLLVGNSTVSVPIATQPRAAAGTLTPTTPTTNYANIINLSGTNTVSPPTPIGIGAGGNLVSFECDSGYLIYNAGITSAGSLRDFAVEGAGSGEVDGSILSAGANSINVYVLGTGRWTFNGQSTYAGSTTISNAMMVVNGSISYYNSNTVTAYGGTLAGTGTIGGPVVIASGATLSPTRATGSSIGTLIITNTLTLQAGSVTVLQLNKTAAANDQIAGLTGATFGGTLQLTNLAGSLAAGDSFHLFGVSGATGSFASIVPATPGAGLAWDTSNLANGYLGVITGVISQPAISSVLRSGSSLIFAGTNGPAGHTYQLLTATNLSIPLTNWTQAATGSFDGSGNFTVTNAPGVSPSFYVLKTQ